METKEIVIMDGVSEALITYATRWNDEYKEVEYEPASLEMLGAMHAVITPDNLPDIINALKLLTKSLMKWHEGDAVPALETLSKMTNPETAASYILGLKKMLDPLGRDRNLAFNLIDFIEQFSRQRLDGLEVFGRNWDKIVAATEEGKLLFVENFMNSVQGWGNIVNDEDFDQYLGIIKRMNKIIEDNNIPDILADFAMPTTKTRIFTVIKSKADRFDSFDFYLDALTLIVKVNPNGAHKSWQDLLEAVVDGLISQENIGDSEKERILRFIEKHKGFDKLLYEASLNQPAWTDDDIRNLDKITGVTIEEIERRAKGGSGGRFLADDEHNFLSFLIHLNTDQLGRADMQFRLPF